MDDGEVLPLATSLHHHMKTLTSTRYFPTISRVYMRMYMVYALQSFIEGCIKQFQRDVGDVAMDMASGKVIDV